ncbi:uncharacterized protein YjgD (DUF1641 family) [Pullulanibacillus pueri]|uniref:DUF1641 domain-containing protein n=1 Tax=Pullulanibacillus pueri TaxID=1437324 RepID=A0A8J3EN03_9BACL|nr:uncharacterized protein YjgD (DUF1641 family) [Pullulanibacillus pueri]GGH86329.1 hypothetical protein GCM10007096_33790 [Pullulanibacillus pueri]
MAKAITQIRRVDPTPEELQAQSISKILGAVAENGEAIMKVMDIVSQLDQMGVLDALDALAKRRVDVAEIMIHQVNQPAMHKVMKNGMNMFKFLGSLNPDQIQMLMDGIGHGVDKATATESNDKKTSLWSLGKAMKKPEVKESLAMLITILEGMGESLQREKGHA